jgi:hypothetical protein
MRAVKGGMGHIWVTWAAALSLAAGLSGCGATGGAKKAPNGGKPSGGSVAVEDGGDLAEVAKAVKTKDDKLILDLLLGYRMLLIHNPDAQKLDKETLRRSRDAYDKLESILRHGGVKAQDAGERVYTITDEERLSLQEVIRSAEQAADKAAREGDLEKARARWKEIVQSKSAVTFTMEEAQWGLTYSDAMQSSLPDSVKRRLKELNENYQSEAAYDEIGKQVKALLEIVPDVKLQRELKKLANRAWERDKKAGRISAQAQQAQAAAAAAGTVPPGESPDTVKPSPGSPAAAAGGVPAGNEPSAAQPGPEAAALSAEADSLAAKGKYVAALKSLDKAGSDQAWVKDKKNQIGDRFCEDMRRMAAGSFKDFKKASSDSLKRVHLKRTAADLDSCLFYFPELPVAQKVRKNREMVESEMRKIK